MRQCHRLTTRVLHLRYRLQGDALQEGYLNMENIMTTYKIVRFFRDTERKVTIEKGLTLEKAKAHCSDPETSSRTATSADALSRTEKYGPWFDGFDEE